VCIPANSPEYTGSGFDGEQGVLGIIIGSCADAVETVRPADCKMIVPG
jgi:hypothetical protein